MRRMCLLLLASLLLPVSMVIAGGQKDSGPGVNTSEAESSSQADWPLEYSLPLADPPVTISFATTENDAGTVSFKDGLPAQVELEKRTGIKIDWQVVPGQSYNETIQIKLASGVGLPDFLNLPPNPIMYAESGSIIPLNRLIEQYAPNIVQLFKDRPAVRKALVAPDKEIYWIPAILDARAVVNYNSYIYRKDWAEKLGLDAPETIDEWYTMLKAFKENDVNGNGDKNDEWPLSAVGAGRGGYFGLNPFAWAYGLMLSNSDGSSDSDNYQADETGKVAYIYTMPRVKDWLTEMNKWYEEGLIDPDFLTLTQDRWMAKIVSNTLGSTCAFSMWTPQLTSRTQDEFPGTYWDTMYPPKGPFGDQNLLRERPVASGGWAITRDSKNPELVMKWVDYMFASEEGKMLVGNYGIEGVTYELVDGKPRFLPVISEDPRGTGAPQWEHGINGPWPRILMRTIIEERFFYHPQSPTAIDAAEKYYVQSFPNIIPTKDENDTIINVMADINTYRTEMITKFILGTESLENFDKYVKTINGMGIEQVTAIKQAQYDRVSK